MKINKKKIGISLLCGTLILGSAFGVAAATEYSNVRSHGLLKINSGDIIIDGDAIGYWIDVNNYTITNNTASIIIKDKNIKTDSIIDIYYGNNGLDKISNAEPYYEQADGSVTIKFRKPQKLDSDNLVIQSIHITNPVNTAIEGGNVSQTSTTGNNSTSTPTP